MNFFIFIIIVIAGVYYFNTDGWSETTDNAVAMGIIGGAAALIVLVVIETLKFLYRLLFGDKSNNDTPSKENENPEEIKPATAVTYIKKYVVVSDHEKWRIEKKVSEYLHRGFECEGSVSQMEVDMVMSYCQSMVHHRYPQSVTEPDPEPVPDEPPDINSDELSTSDFSKPIGFVVVFILFYFIF